MKWKVGTSFLILITFLISWSEDHAIYVSVLEIEHQNSSDQATVIFKVFKDDLRDAVQNHSGKSFHFDSIQNIDYQQSIINYLEHVFMANLNTERMLLSGQKFELTGESVWITGEAKVSNKWSALKISTTLFTELFPSQTNVLQIKVAEQRYFERLDRDKTEVTFEF